MRPPACQSPPSLAPGIPRARRLVWGVGDDCRHVAPAALGLGLVDRTAGRRVRAAGRGGDAERPVARAGTGDRRAAGGDRRSDADPPRATGDRGARLLDRGTDVHRRRARRSPSPRRAGDRRARGRGGAAGGALRTRADRDDAVAADGRDRSQLSQHRQGCRPRGLDGARLVVRLSGVDVLARAGPGLSWTGRARPGRRHRRRHRRWPTASASAPPAPRPRRSASCWTSNTSAGRARPRSW